MSLERFCRKRVVTAAPDDSACTVARRMRSEHVGCVVIVEGSRPVGIVTDRDLTLAIVADRGDPDTPIESLMSRSLFVVRTDRQIDDAVSLMREAGVRRLPIVDRSDALRGLVSLDDIEVLLAAELHASALAIEENQGP